MNIFTDTLKRSGLLSESEFEARIAEFQKSGIDLSDPKATGRAFINAGIVTSWQAEKLILGKHKGFFLGKYVLKRLLGRGGMSAVYLAEHSVMKRQCAIKVLPASRVDDSSYLGRFHLEAQAAAALDDPHIVRAYDVDEFDDGKSTIHFLVMEYVEGRNLHELVMKDGILPPLDAAEFIRQATMGLQHAHDAGLVHRDIKPANLLLDTRGTIKILDMGLARFFEDGDENSLTIQHDEKVLGTADFLSPEQAINSHNVDSRADIYSLGCTMYFMLTRHSPFEQGSLAQRLMAHQTQEPPPVSKYRTDVPDSLLEILNKMMAKKPDDRFQKATDITEALKNWILENADQDWLDNHEKHWSSSSKSSPTNPSPEQGSQSSTSPPDSFGDFLTMIGKEEPTSDVEPNSDKASNTKVSGPTSTVTTKQTSTDSRVNPAADPPSNKSKRGSQKIAGSGTQRRKSGASSIKKTEEAAKGTPSLVDQLKTNTQWQIGAGILALLVAFGAWWMISSGDPTPKPPQQSSNDNSDSKDPSDSVQPMTEDVPLLGKEFAVGPDEEIKTLGEALDYLKKYNDPLTFKERTIQLKAGYEIQENLSFKDLPMNFPKKLKISGDDGARNDWKGNGTDPLLVLDGAEGLVIENIRFNANLAPVAIRASGLSPSLIIRKCSIVGFTKTGLELNGLAGFYQSAIRLEDLRISCQTASATGIAIMEGPASTENLRLHRIIFSGPLANGIDLDSDLVSELTIRECRFDKQQTGIRFSASSPKLGSIIIAHDTFNECEQAIVWNSVPAEGSSGIEVTRNLFVNNKQADFVVESSGDTTLFNNAFAEGTASKSWNYTTRPKPEGDQPTIFGEHAQFSLKDFKFKSTEPGNPEYLKPADGRGRIEGRTNYRGHVGAVTP